MQTNILIAAISYILGILSGYLLRNALKDSINPSSAKNIVLLVVTIMWAMSVAVEIVNPAYKTSPLIHGLMGSIVGFFYKFTPTKEA